MVVSKIKLFIHCLVGMIFLIAGNLLFFNSEKFRLFIQLFSSSYILIYIIMNRHFLFLNKYHILYLLVGGGCLLFGMINSYLIEYAFLKFDSIILNCFFVFLYFSILLLKYGFDNFFKNLIFVGIFLLLPTLIYKYLYGFFQRDVRFFLNGANVFGWLYGFYALLCLLFLKNKIYYIYFLICVSCVFWSQSKGAIISLTICGLLLIAYKNKFNLVGFLKIISIVPIIFFIKYMILIFFPESRINALFRILEGKTDDSDYGSVGIRMEMYSSALDLFSKNYFFGVGLGDFSIYTNYNIMYPHNVPLELLAEVGILGISFFIIYYILMFVLGKNQYLKIFSIYFFVVCLFSGDLSYLRYSFVFVLLCISIKSFDVRFIKC